MVHNKMGTNTTTLSFQVHSKKVVVTKRIYYNFSSDGLGTSILVTPHRSESKLLRYVDLFCLEKKACSQKADKKNLHIPCSVGIDVMRSMWWEGYRVVIFY